MFSSYARYSIKSSSSLADLPKFGELLQNVTVPVSREAVLQCVVDNLQTYKVSSARFGSARCQVRWVSSPICGAIRVTTPAAASVVTAATASQLGVAANGNGSRRCQSKQFTLHQIKRGIVLGSVPRTLFGR